MRRERRRSSFPERHDEQPGLKTELVTTMPRLNRPSAGILATLLALQLGLGTVQAQDGAVEVPPAPSSDSPAANQPGGYFAPQRVPLDLPQDAAESAVADAPRQPASGTFKFPDPRTGKEWVVSVTPAAKPESPAARAYRDAYAAIPYRRAEYLANPAYRHEAAMELMFGQMRPTVIQKQQTPERIVNPIPVVERPYLYSRNEMYGLYPRLRYGAWTESPYYPMPLP